MDERQKHNSTLVNYLIWIFSIEIIPIFFYCFLYVIPQVGTLGYWQDENIFYPTMWYALFSLGSRLLIALNRYKKQAFFGMIIAVFSDTFYMAKMGLNESTEKGALLGMTSFAVAAAVISIIIIYQRFFGLGLDNEEFECAICSSHEIKDGKCLSCSSRTFYLTEKPAPFVVRDVFGHTEKEAEELEESIKIFRSERGLCEECGKDDTLILAIADDEKGVRLRKLCITCLNETCADPIDIDLTDEEIQEELSDLSDEE